ncbi:MAG: PH domain-containing protein [Lachnospiraceae bacterium]|nr:PH domain-containing protein [Lachnospiraceae bacterium]
MGSEFNDEEEMLVEKKRWALFGLPFTFTKYYVKKDILTIESGFFNKTEDDCYMYKIQDVELQRGFFQRMFGLGCVVCFTGDTTHPKLYLHNIKNSKETKDFILKYSEEARLKRRTLNTLNIGAHDIDDVGEDC